jgi:hypothetical protein
MENETYLNKWLICKTLYYKDEFQEINNLDLVHDDFKEFVKNNRTQTIFKCIQIEDNWLLLHANKFYLKVNPKSVIKILPDPVYEWGTKVCEANRPEIVGVVEELLWHQKRQEFLYFISIQNKKKSRQFSTGELILAD